MHFNRETTQKFLFSLLILLAIGFFIRVGTDIFKDIIQGTPFRISLFFLRIIEFALPSGIILLIRKFYTKGV